MGTESEGLGTQYLKANTELRHSALSRAESAVVPLEGREGMGGQHTLETDLTRSHRVLEDGDKFESSFLRLDRCFLALLRVDTHLLQAFWNVLRLPLVRFAFQEEMASCFRASLCGRIPKLS